MQPRTRKVVSLGLIGLTVAVSVFVAMALVSIPGPGSLVTPGGGPNAETLCSQSSGLNSSTNATFKIMNCGFANTITLVAYYVNSGQNVYANPNWAGPSIPKGTQVPVNIVIDGQAFTFQPGNSYTIEVVSARNNQFTFTLTT